MDARVILGYVNSVRDPIWVQVPLTALEADIIDTPVFARLRHIRQMGFAYLAFPGANHTRYEHSVGVMRAAHLMYEMFRDIPTNVDAGLAIRSLRIAALLHDIGHPPFSHAVEEAFRKYPHLLGFPKKTRTKPVQALRKILGNPPDYSHERFSSHVIETNKEISALIGGQGLDVGQIKMLAIGKAQGSGLGSLNAVVDGDFDADKIDYIVRDSYYCGLSYKIDLNEFRDKLYVDSIGNGQSFRLLTLPEGVPAIYSLLLARYKLIKEVHNNETNRIATQMFVEKIRVWLEDLADEERARAILDMHESLTDHDLITRLGACKKGPKMDDVLNGRLYGSRLVFPLERMHPIVKASTHLVVNNPTRIAGMQEQLRDDFGDKQLLLDIREHRPPQFTTLIAYEGERDGKKTTITGNIFDRYYAAHGILIDSFNDVAIYAYSPASDKARTRAPESKGVVKETETMPSFYFERLDPAQEIVGRRVVLAARQLRKDKSNRNIILDVDLLMLVLAALESYGKEALGRRELWLYADSAFQGYLRKVIEYCAKNRLGIESDFVWDNQRLSTKLFRDLERLQNMGLVDHIHKPVPYFGGWSFRIDRRVSGWGKGYVNTELANLHGQVYDHVHKTLEAAHTDLETILQMEEECTAFDDMDTISEREPLNREIDQVRKRLRASGDVIFTIG